MKTWLHYSKNRVPVQYWRPGLLFAVLSCFLVSAPLTGLHAQMSGTYTVCSSGCNYTTISGVVGDLTSKGVKGKVTVNIAAGKYNDQIYFSSSVSGASSTNTITFNGSGAYGSTATYIYYNGSPALYLYGVSYINVKNIEFENTGSSSYCAYMYSTSHCRSEHCQFLVAAGSTSMYPLYEYYCSNMYFGDCRFYGGYENYRWYTSGSATNDTFKNVHIVAYYEYGNYVYYGKYNYFGNSLIDSGYNGYGYYTTLSVYESYAKYENNVWAKVAGYYCLFELGDHKELVGNDFGSASHTYYYNEFVEETAVNIHNNILYGYEFAIYLDYVNYSSTTDPCLVFNNMLSSNIDYALYIYENNSGNRNAHILHNTMYSLSSYGMELYNYNGATGWDIRNNNIYSNGTYAVYEYGTFSSNNIWSGNNLYTTGSTLVNWNNTTYAKSSDFESYMQSLGLGLYDGNVKSTFVNAPTDLHYSSSSPLPWGKAITASTDPVKITKDYDYDSRCTLFATAGADEGNPSFTTPTSSFTGPSKIVDGYPALFKNGGSINNPAAYRWYVNGKFVSDSFQLYTAALKSPSSTVSLVTVSCAGKDSVTKTFTVSSPTKAPLTDFISDKNIIRSGEVVQFNDLSPNYPSKWTWTISPAAINYFGSTVPTFQVLAGSLSSPNPQIRFDYPGKYKICLTTSNSVGSGGTECKNDYITVLGAYMVSSSDTKISDTKGYLYDEGGPNGAYTYHYGTTYSATIDPGCASKVYMIFNYFNTQCGYVYIKVYDGSNASGTNLSASLCPSTGYGYGPGFTGGPSSSCGYMCYPKVTDTLVATSGKMHVEETTYSNLLLNGFEAYFWSDLKTQKLPKASFSSADSACTNTSFDFTNTSTGDDLSYEWDLDGDLSYFEDTKANTSWPFIFPGDYTVTLIAYNCSGSDTATKVIHVADPPKPVAAFHADNSNPTSNDIVFLYPDVKQCVDDYKWRVVKKYGSSKVTYVNGTGISSEIPQVVLGDTGCYNVTLAVSNNSGADSIFKSCYLYVKNPYCIPSVTNTISDLGISEVKLNTIDNMSKQSGGYENYTPTVSTKLEIGVTYPFTISRATSANTASRVIYIDWNDDGDFNDSLETVRIEKPGRSLSWVDSLTVPAFAKLGATVMRVAITQGSQTSDPCNNSFGEYEDYRIYITQDETAPVITLLGADTIRVEQGNSFTDPGATALDNLSGNLTSRIKVTNQNFDVLTPGTYIFTYNVKDDAGNPAIPKKRVVIVSPDMTAPDLQVVSDDTVYVGVFTSFTVPQASAYDLVDGDLTNKINVNNPVNVNKVGTYIVSYQVADVTANSAFKDIVVIVEDTTAPKLILNGLPTVYVDVKTAYADAGVDDTDNYYSRTILNPLVQVQSNVDINKIGTYTVTYSLTDPSGNMAKTLTRTVIVQDIMPPTVTEEGDSVITMEVYSKFTDPGLKISDNYYTSGWTIDTSGTYLDAFGSGTAVATKLGTYNITYKVTDPSGNATIKSRTIMVIDDQAPMIELVGSPTVNTCRWSNYDDSSFSRYTVKDNYYTLGNGLTITEEGTFKDQGTSLPGVYSFRYIATDSSGNVGYSDWREVNVISSDNADCFTGIMNSNELARYFTIYPNPSTGIFTISSNLSSEKEVRITVTNLLGQQINISTNEVLGKGQTQIDLSNQSAGVYLLNIYTNDQVITKRIEISK
jgi:PKD repeat protein